MGQRTAHLVDTNTWSYLQEGHPEVTAHLHALPGDATLCMSVVSQAELLGGIQWVAAERRRIALTALYEQSLAMASEVLPITTRVAVEFASIYAALRRKGRPIETNDIWIAATALAYDLVLVRSDQHFQYVDGLTVEDGTRP